jgi:hypothetical protein
MPVTRSIEISLSSGAPLSYIGLGNPTASVGRLPVDRQEPSIVIPSRTGSPA